MKINKLWLTQKISFETVVIGEVNEKQPHIAFFTPVYVINKIYLIPKLRQYQCYCLHRRKHVPSYLHRELYGLSEDNAFNSVTIRNK